MNNPQVHLVILDSEFHSRKLVQEIVQENLRENLIWYVIGSNILKQKGRILASLKCSIKQNIYIYMFLLYIMTQTKKNLDENEVNEMLEVVGLL